MGHLDVPGVGMNYGLRTPGKSSARSAGGRFRQSSPSVTPGRKTGETTARGASGLLSAPAELRTGRGVRSDARLRRSRTVSPSSEAPMRRSVLAAALLLALPVAVPARPGPATAPAPPPVA